MTLRSVGICVSEYRFMQLLLFLSCPTVCVTGAGASVDSACEQKKLEARKMLAVIPAIVRDAVLGDGFPLTPRDVLNLATYSFL